MNTQIALIELDYNLRMIAPQIKVEIWDGDVLVKEEIAEYDFTQHEDCCWITDREIQYDYDSCNEIILDDVVQYDIMKSIKMGTFSGNIYRKQDYDIT